MPDPLQQAQLDLTARLRSSDLLTDLAIYDLRPRSAEEAAAIQDTINSALAGMVGPETRAGLTILVPVPLFEVDKPDVPAPVGEIVLSVQVLEQIMINEGAGGTGLSCEGAALTVLRLGHQLVLRPNQILFADGMRPLEVDREDWSADVAWEVRFRVRGGFDPLPSCDLPSIVNAAGEITITATTSGAAVYYTLDGSYPWHGNPAAALYDTPFAAPAAGTSLRAIATKPGLADSGAAELNL